MKQSLIAGVLIYISILCLPALAVEKRFSFTDFSEIQYSIPGTLYLSQSDEYKIVVKGTEEQIEDIVIQKNGNALVIREEWSLYGIGSTAQKGVKIRVYLPKLEAVTASSSGSIKGLTSFTTSEKITVTTSSSGDIHLSAQVGAIEAVCSSSGSIRLRGKVASLVLETKSKGNIGFSGEVSEYLQATSSSMGKISCALNSDVVVPESRLEINSMGNISVTGRGNHVVAGSSSAGDLLLKDFQCREMTIDLTSSGSAFINVTGDLKLNTSSSGKIVNHGSPRIN